MASKIAGKSIHPAANAYPMMPADRLAQLAADIKENGLIEPVTLFEGKILDGRNRLTACEIAGVEPEFVDYTGSEPYSWVASKNSQRRDLTEGERAEAGLRLVDGISKEVAIRAAVNAATTRATREAAREEAIARGETPSEDPPAPKRNRKAEKANETAFIVASKVGVSGSTMERALRVQRNAPELIAAGALRKLPVRVVESLSKESPSVREEARKEIGKSEGPMATSKIRELVRGEEKLRVAADITSGKIEDPTGQYRTVVIDPPWQYAKRAADPTHRGNVPYPTMSLDEIIGMGPMIDGLTHDEGTVMWLWTTNAFMGDAYKILEAWGYTPKTVLTWVKNRIGLGDWLRGQSEHCIIAVRNLTGTPKWWGGVDGTSPHSTILNADVTEHSAKPDAFYALVDSMSAGSRIELFARGAAREGWDTWGAEATPTPAPEATPTPAPDAPEPDASEPDTDAEPVKGPKVKGPKTKGLKSKSAPIES